MSHFFAEAVSKSYSKVDPKDTLNPGSSLEFLELQRFVDLHVLHVPE